MSISKRTAAVYAFAYALPYCTKKFIFCRNKHSISNNQLPLIVKKLDSNVKWSGFQTPFEIRTKKSRFPMVGKFENWSSFQTVKID
jgi:hypothetical protein